MSDSLLDRYYEQFGEEFPLMQAPELALAETHINNSLRVGKRVAELYPGIYGAAEGKKI